MPEIIFFPKKSNYKILAKTFFNFSWLANLGAIIKKLSTDLSKYLPLLFIFSECYGYIFKEAAANFSVKVLKQIFLYWQLILCIFKIITFVIAPSKLDFISGFTYILFTTALAGKKIDQTVISTVDRIILKRSPVLVLASVSHSSIFKYPYIPHFLEANFLSKRKSFTLTR